MTSILCFYHAPCNDGAASAAALQYRLEHDQHLQGKLDMNFVQLAHTTEWLELYEEHYVDQIRPDHPVSEIYILDAIYSQPKHEQILAHLRDIDRLGTDAPRTICIDHHATAIDKKEELAKFCDEMLIKIGTGLSAATLVWEYFNDKSDKKLPTPKLLQYVADQDVWEWRLHDSKVVNAALNMFEGNQEEMQQELEDCIADEQDWFDKRKQQGEIVLAMVKSQVHKAMGHVTEIQSGPTLLRIVNSSAFSSELGNFLCQQSHDAPNAIALVYSVQKDWSVKCSFRSISGGATTARALAEKFGGGGHDNAAGCRFADFAAFQAALAGLRAG